MGDLKRSTRYRVFWSNRPFEDCEGLYKNIIRNKRISGNTNLITAVKLRWPENKSVFDSFTFSSVCFLARFLPISMIYRPPIELLPLKRTLSRSLLVIKLFYRLPKTFLRFCYCNLMDTMVLFIWGSLSDRRCKGEGKGGKRKRERGRKGEGKTWGDSNWPSVSRLIL